MTSDSDSSPPPAITEKPTLSATYSAPDSAEKGFNQLLPMCSEEPSPTERTAYLAALRTSITDAQDQINAFLTQKMDEDNAKAGTASAEDDAKAEENYGEEVVNDD
ncbi:putative ekc keops complex subunit gon7 protein [Venturia nashicola]|uniref:EKC/KEOPS complex subunit GON7 n=1 Tax=Venturia nashicola TaxID=86259 RepID=A0A4Z1PP84_9PEZI|nr:putative ekc keops complex subunit gon7 protein [Venturia nashicola]